MPKKLDNETFIKKAQSVHGNRYDYSEVQYVNAKTPVTIICSIHGEFTQTPNEHIYAANGCQKCAMIARNRPEVVKKRSEALKGHRVSEETKKKISESNKGKKHSDEARANMAKAKLGKSRVDMYLPLPEAQRRFYEVHPNDIEVDWSTYTKVTAPVHCTCLKCGHEWNPIFDNLMRGHGCPNCNTSNGEKQVENFLKSSNIEYVAQKRFPDCRDKHTLPFDFYIPKLSICIEYQGEQHYEPVECWGGKDYFPTQQYHDQIKRDYCREKNITLIEIKHSEEVAEVLARYFH